ncbi:MAG: GntR family transcriptional regulator [Lachnospiraceae bacterium]|nr:GntR family transcriptional regulator [Lachnospiraceae bacterium]MCR5410786.1 GntR family transcriptional regulator [Lachnospiraceae bacterium]
MNSSLNQLTYEYMKKDIMTFALKPGEPVSAAKIAERYSVSRTPAREALVKLETEGLVDIFPQSKSVISKIDVDRAKQEWFIRKTLELGMVDALFEGVRKSDILKMRSFCRKMEEIAELPKSHDLAYEYLRCDNEFHSMTYYIAGQSLAAELISNTMTHYNRIRLLIDLDSYYKDRTVTTHEQLIRYVEEGKKEEYRELLGKHLGYITQDIDDMRGQNPDLFKS